MCKHTISLALFLVSSFLVKAQKVSEPQNTPADWSKPYPPFKIVGNLYYVGSYDLACYLITTTQGNLLINTGLASSASLIKANIETLGFKFSDTKILLITQAHFDHAGAMATIKKLTGARMLVNGKDADVMETGGSSDYALGGRGSTYEPVSADSLLKDGDIIRLGSMQITMLHHPGHTKGSSSFLFSINDSRKVYRVLIANMPTIVTEKSFDAVTEYPDIARDYKYTLNAMKKVSFDIWLSSHASQFKLHDKHRPGQQYNPPVFVDRKGYDAVLKDLQNELSKKIKKK